VGVVLQPADLVDGREHEAELAQPLGKQLELEEDGALVHLQALVLYCVEGNSKVVIEANELASAKVGPGNPYQAVRRGNPRTLPSSRAISSRTVRKVAL
jgi:hypothetical protein